jgi:hypothetical protein
VSNEALLNYAEALGDEIVYYPLKKYKAVTFDEQDKCHIALAKNLGRCEEKELVAHELGHCEYGGTYCHYSSFEITAKSEKRAAKWAFYKLVPPGDVRAAFGKGVVESWDLAELFDVSCEFICEALEYYKAVGII